MAHPIAPARALQQVRRIAHRLGAAGDHHVHVAGVRRLDRVDDRLQTRAAHAVHRLAGHLWGSPALSAACRATFMPGAGLQHAPHDHVAHVLGLTPARAIASRITTAPRSAAVKSLSAPPNDPIGVRQALTG